MFVRQITIYCAFNHNFCSQITILVGAILVFADTIPGFLRELLDPPRGRASWCKPRQKSWTKAPFRRRTGGEFSWDLFGTEINGWI